jgi:hypothetical protein
MDIIINDEKIDYEIENERNLGDILRGLEIWVTKNGGIIDCISVDETDIPLDYPPEYQVKSISSVNRLKIKTSPKFEYAVDTIKITGEYISKIISEYVDSRDVEQYENTLEGIQLVCEGIEHSLQTLFLRDLVIANENGRTLRDILSDLRSVTATYEEQYIDDDGSVKLKGLLHELLHILPKVVGWANIKSSLRVTERNSVEGSFLKTILQDLENISKKAMNRFESIAENLQIGRDREALEDLSYVAELLDEIIYVLQYFISAYDMDGDLLLKSGIGIEALFNKISHWLKEVEKSFKNGDLVSVGDMLEYELKPLFQEMVELLNKIGLFIQ